MRRKKNKRKTLTRKEIFDALAKGQKGVRDLKKQLDCVFRPSRNLILD